MDLVKDPVITTTEKIEIQPDSDVIHVGCVTQRILPAGSIIKTLCGQYRRTRPIRYPRWREVPFDLRCVVCEQLTEYYHTSENRACAVTGSCKQNQTCTEIQKMF